MKKNIPIVEAEIKILQKCPFKCFYYKFTFSLRGKIRGKRSNILTFPE